MIEFLVCSNTSGTKIISYTKMVNSIPRKNKIIGPQTEEIPIKI